MKANNGIGNIPERDEWQTPNWLYDLLNKQYKFSFDCCSTDDNSKSISFSDNFLNIKKGWITQCCWMNPPFSKANEMFKHFFKVVYNGVAIYRCDNFETKIWQNVIFPYATWIFIPNKRIAYEGMDGNGSRFPSALIGLNVDVPNNIKGTLLVKPNEE